MSTEEHSQERVIERLARKIVGMRLEAPASLFLQMHLPMVGLAHASALMFQPLLAPVFGTGRMATLSHILSERKNVSELIERIETLTRERDGA